MPGRPWAPRAATIGLVRYLCDSGNPETSTGVSLDALVGEPTLQDPARTNAVLLLTDGGESNECTDVIDVIDGPGGVANLLAQPVPVNTFAVGMGGASLSQLEQIATAGGTGQPYFADQPADLQMALAAIASAVASCTFHGAACEGIQDGSVVAIDIVYGCNMLPVG